MNIKCKYNVTTTSAPTKIMFNTTGIDAMKIDGTVYAASTEFTFSSIGENTVEINAYTLPEKTFLQIKALTYVETIGEIRTLPPSMFYGCENLKTVIIGNEVMYLGDSIFAFCEITNLVIGNGVKTLPPHMFSGSTITDFVIPDTIEHVASYAFSSAYNLKNIVIGEGVKTIGTNAFGLYVENIDSKAENAPLVSYHTFETHNVNITYPQGSDYQSWFETLNSDLPTGEYYVTCKYNFANPVSDYKQIIFDTKHVSYMVYNGNNYPVSITNPFDDNYPTITFVFDTPIIDRKQFFSCLNLTEVTIGEGFTEICEDAFSTCPELDFCELPNTLKILGKGAFAGTSLDYITLPLTLQYIDDKAFYNGYEAASFVIDDNVQYLGQEVFGTNNILTIACTGFNPIPCIQYNTFQGVPQRGTLNYWLNTDFTDWFYGEKYDLAYYRWNRNMLKLICEIPSTIKEQTYTPFTVTYLTGKTVNFNTPDNIIITEGQTVDNGNGTQTTTYQLYINEEYSSPTANIIITDGENTITKTITVEEKEDPMAAPTISINRYADLAFPQSGATKYITITYTNTSTSYISTPYSSEPDVTISQESVTVTDNGVEIYYGIHVPATQYERNIPLIFSCSSPEGSSATETFTGLQDGEERPAGLTLSSTSGSFAAEGESKAITATYPSGKTLNVSVASSTGVRPIAWCTATSDGTTGGSTVYTITMTANEFTESRTALVNFSYQADGGEYITAQYVAVQSAAGGAGEESSLSLYRTVMNFSADGVFDFGAAVCKADYRWTEEVDIDEPEVDVSWIVVSEGEHQTGAGYIIVPWGIAVARNISTSSRTGTVTFSSVGNDDIMHTAVLTVTQEGSGGGEEQEPEGVNLIWKDLPVELPDDDMVYELLDENYDVFFKGRSAKRPSDEANRFYLNRIMQDYIYMDEIPELVATTGTVRHHDNAMKTVRIDYDGIIGATPAYNFKYDWSYTYDSPFILSESIIPYFVQGQRLLITCCNINDNNPQTDVYTFISGGQVQSGSISADAHDYKTMSVAVPSNTDVILLGGQRYEVLRSCQYRYVLYYLSPKGGWCWFPVMGRVSKKDNVTQYSYTKNYDNQTAEFGKSRYLAEIGTKYELNTGWLREHESLRMWEVLETNMAYLHDLYENKVIPVIMTDETVEHKNKARDRKLISYSFNVEASQPKVRF